MLAQTVQMCQTTPCYAEEATEDVSRKCHEGAQESSTHRQAKRMDEDVVVTQHRVKEYGTRLSTPDRRAVLAAPASSMLERPSIHTAVDRVVRRVRHRSSPSSYTKRAPSTHSAHITNLAGPDRTEVTMHYFAEQPRSPQRHHDGQRNPWRVATDFCAALGDCSVTQHGHRGADCTAECATISARPSVPTARAVGHPQWTPHSLLTPAVRRPNTAPPDAAAHPDDLRRFPRTLTLARTGQESESAQRR